MYDADTHIVIHNRHDSEKPSAYSPVAQNRKHMNETAPEVGPNIPISRIHMI